MSRLMRDYVVFVHGQYRSEHLAFYRRLCRGRVRVAVDGGLRFFLRIGRRPDVLIGDLDSISTEARTRFADRLIHLPSQNSSDLEKALVWVAEQGGKQVTVLGLTGRRDDHALGNLILLWTDFGLEVMGLTDSGQFTLVRHVETFTSFKDQPVSLFPSSTSVQITTEGLVYPLDSESLNPVHKGTSNRSLGTRFTIRVAGGPVLVFQEFP